MFKYATALLALTAVLAAPAGAATHNLAPKVAFSVHDEPVDGFGDSFNTMDLIRYQSTRADKAMQEFDVTALAGLSVASATVSGKVYVNNAYDNGVRTFDFLLYAGNGLSDLSDYEIAATKVGSGKYHPPIDSSFAFSFDVTGVVQTLLLGGASHIGLRCEATSNPNFPNILDKTLGQLVIITGAPTWTDLGYSLAGTLGAPVLAGYGTLAGGTQVNLNLANALPFAPAALILGTQNISVPFLGGTLVPAAQVLLLGIPVSSSGEIAITTAAPTGIPPGVPLFLQYWIADPAGPAGYSASNAVTVVTP